MLADLLIQIKIIALTMNNTFDFVQNSLLNHSKTKQSHLFSKAQRFLQPRNSYCIKSAYDLTKTMFTSSIEKRRDSLSKQERFRSSATLVPSPDTYHHKSFVDLSQNQKKGNTFRRQQKFKNISKNYLFPGPANYESNYNPEKKLSYTMRNRVNVPDHRPKIGPADYNIQRYHTLSSSALISSKYNNPKTIKIGTAERFSKNASVTPGNGPFAYSRMKTDFNTSGSMNSTFGKMAKQPSYIPKQKTPAPNYYNHFSQFSQLKGEMRSMQNLSMRNQF